jgi:pSer/pThr/pTyr-binding forkhead associated (FHA) protein
MDEYIDVKIDIFEHSGQRARVRKKLTIKGLVEEILKEFDDIGVDSPEKYTLHLKGIERALNPNQNLIQLDIQPQDELVLGYVRQTLRQMLDPSQYAVLVDEATGKEFDIQWQPAIIGRPNNEVDHNIMLAANLLVLPNGMTVSRRHAQITHSGGQFYIEALAENNPVYLKSKELAPYTLYEIRNGDRLVFGRRKLTMVFRTRSRPVHHTPPPGSSARVDRQSDSVPASSRSTPDKAGSPPEMATRIGMVALPTANLVIEASSNPALAGERISLSAPPVVLGRSLPVLSMENSVSRRHAEIMFDGGTGAYIITDLNSTNGVTLNGEQIPPGVPHEMKPGMVIGLGKMVVVRFEL